MSDSFKPGDAVSWNSEAGRVHGEVTQVHHQTVEFMGKTRPASPAEPQYEVKSAKTGHLALHHGSALRHLHQENRK